MAGLLTLLVTMLAFELSLETPVAHAEQAQITFQCSCRDEAGNARLVFVWFGLEANAKELWLDYSLIDNTFAAESFRSAGPLRPVNGSHTADDLPGNTRIYARVNQLIDGDAWLPSRTFETQTLGCGAPSAPPPPAAPTPAP